MPYLTIAITKNYHIGVKMRQMPHLYLFLFGKNEKMPYLTGLFS
jgi:hypothetical protein